MNTEKLCVRCKQVKPVTDFYQRARTYRYAGKVFSPMSLCIECCKAKANERYTHRRPVVPEGMKWCGRCKKIKAKTEFEPNRARQDGVQNYCRGCRKPYQRARDAQWRSVLHGEATLKQVTPSALRKRVYTYVALAIFFGDLIKKGCCESCGARGTQAHHTDYLQPLTVAWLCRACHSKAHNGKFTGYKGHGM